jgi:murein DD-endopeptidase MepM/ murein hydrolase activator NlpD
MKKHTIASKSPKFARFESLLTTRISGVVLAGLAVFACTGTANAADAAIANTAAANAASAASDAAVDVHADMQYRSLFQTWKKLDDGDQGAVISIPSVQPVDTMRFTSTFGIRSDPFRRVAAMHAGIDIAQPIGTPVYATADGMIDRAERAGGYGNMVEIDHGKGIQTRYGHLSKILVAAGTRVHRGQLIALVGSTGRSTGPHLHYEVRLDGHAVNPLPFLQNADYMVAAQDKSIHTVPVATGEVASDSPEE